MKVVLLQDVKGLGKADEVKDVAEGYARNFLFQKHLAVMASDKALKDIKNRKEKETKEAEANLHMEQSLADRLEKIELVVKEKASESGVLYAGVGPQTVHDELKKRGIKIDKNQIENKVLKTAGEGSFKIKLHHGLEASILVRVETL